MTDIFKAEGADLLIKAIVDTENEEDCKNLLEDMMTTKEILAISQRMQVVKLLRENKSYAEICQETGASTATISRVNRCYVYGNGGYKTAFNKMESKGE